MTPENLRRRLRGATVGDGTFDEEAHVERIAKEIERAKLVHAELLEKQRLSMKGEEEVEEGSSNGRPPGCTVRSGNGRLDRARGWGAHSRHDLPQA